MSPSPSPGWENYSRTASVGLPVNDNDLPTPYSTSDYTDVSTSNNVRVAQSASLGDIAMHQYKDFASVATTCTIDWEGQTDEDPALNAVYLQIYNHNTTTWDTLASNSVASPNVDFTISVSVSDLTNYKDGSNVISCRIWQQSL